MNPVFIAFALGSLAACYAAPSMIIPLYGFFLVLYLANKAATPYIYQHINRRTNEAEQHHY